jgi:hypothetical protein
MAVNEFKKNTTRAFKKMITAVDTHAGEPMRVITGIWR